MDSCVHGTPALILGENQLYLLDVSEWVGNDVDILCRYSVQCLLFCYLKF